MKQILQETCHIRGGWSSCVCNGNVKKHGIR